MKNECIDIIIPSYNSSKTIANCLDSILASTYQNFNIIIVDDGSKDNTVDIIDKYSKKDARIKYFTKKNGGVSSARNFGIEHAKSPYIAFVDSDDTVQPEMYERCILSMENANADIVICGINVIEEKGIRRKFSYDKKYNCVRDMKNDFMELSRLCFLNPPWNKVYKRDKITNTFKNDVTMYEDYIFCLDYLQNCKIIKMIPDCLYNYDRRNVGSLEKTYREELFNNIIECHNKNISFCHKFFGYDLDKYMYGVLYINLFSCISKLVTYTQMDSKKMEHLIKQWSNNNEIRKALFNKSKNSVLISKNIQFCIIKIFLKKNMFSSVIFYFTLKKKLKFFLECKIKGRKYLEK